VTRAPVVVLASGTGTLFQALITAGESVDYPAKIVGFVTDAPECGAQQRARLAGLPVQAVSPKDFPDRTTWNAAIAAAVAAWEPTWVVCLGFMRILGPNFLQQFPNQIINTHPSLLPSFPGAHAVADAFDYGVQVSGCTVHVVDEGVDTGPILAQTPVAVLASDTSETLHERIKTAERELIVGVVAQLARGGYEFDGRRAKST